MSISLISKSSSYRTGGRTLFIDFQQNGVVKSLRDSKGNCASCISESEKGKREISPSQSEEPWNLGEEKKKISYLFLSQPIAASVLADLVAFLVPARSAVSTVVFPLATRTFPAPLSLFLRRLLVGVCVLAPAEQVRVNINNVTMITITITTAITIISTEANLLRSEVRKFKPGESDPLPEGSAGGLNAAARPGEGVLAKEIILEWSKQEKMSSVRHRYMWSRRLFQFCPTSPVIVSGVGSVEDIAATWPGVSDKPGSDSDLRRIDCDDGQEAVRESFWFDDCWWFDDSRITWATEQSCLTRILPGKRFLPEWKRTLLLLLFSFLSVSEHCYRETSVDRVGWINVTRTAIKTTKYSFAHFAPSVASPKHRIHPQELSIWVVSRVSAKYNF